MLGRACGVVPSSSDLCTGRITNALGFGYALKVMATPFSRTGVTEEMTEMTISREDRDLMILLHETMAWGERIAGKRELPV